MSNLNATQMCNNRRYVYLIPVFSLYPHAHHDRESVLMWEERNENVMLHRKEKWKAFEQGFAGLEAVAQGVSEEASQLKGSEVQVPTVECREVNSVVVVKTEESEVEGYPQREPFEFEEAILEELNEILSRWQRRA